MADPVTASTSSFVPIIQAVHQGGYFGIAALMLLVYLAKGWKNVPREFTLLAGIMLVLGAAPLFLPKQQAPPACRKPQISVSLEPENLRQITYALALAEDLPPPRLLLPVRRQCAGPALDPACPSLGMEFEMESDHEIVRVSLAEAVEALHKRLANVQSAVAAATSKGITGPGSSQ